MKTEYLVTLFIFIYSCSFGQAHHDFLTSQANRVDIVVEGKVISKRVFFDTNLNYYLTEYEVDVYRQFKGEPVNTLYFYMQGGIVENGKGEIWSHVQNVKINREGVFFLKNYTVLEKSYIMPAGNKAILRYDKRKNYIRAYVSGYEYNDLILEKYLPIEKCSSCYNRKLSKK